MAQKNNDEIFKNVISHAKEYGFVFQSSEIYDGLSAVYDYGQLGAELKNNLKTYWWKAMVQMHENIVGIDAAIFMHPKVWKASGHVDGFNDPMIDNKDSKKRYRADQLLEGKAEEYAKAGDAEKAQNLLNEMEPYQSGGNMIQDVTFEEIKYHKAPNRFEAGTGNIADAIGLGAAIDYVSKIGIEVIGQYEHYLLEYATHLLKQIPGIRLIGTAANKASVLSFTLQGFTNDAVGQALNKEGIAVRTGHHCAQPILRRMGVETTVRPSLAFYNTTQDVDVFIDTLWKLKTRK